MNEAAYDSFKDDFIASNPSVSDPIYHIYLAHDAVKSLALAFHNVIERGVADEGETEQRSTSVQNDTYHRARFVRLFARRFSLQWHTGTTGKLS